MSGSGGSGSGGFDSGSENCEDLVINTQLSSPKANVVALITVGDELDLEVRTLQNTVVVVAVYKGEVAGGIASTRMARLRECIEDGTKYLARVTAKNDGQVSVRVSAR